MFGLIELVAIVIPAPDLAPSSLSMPPGISYPGGKRGAHVPRLLSLMPPHRLYVEPFCGGGAIFIAKPLAPSTIVADIDAVPLSRLAAHPLPGVDYRVSDAVELLDSLSLDADALVYLDPPYVHATRSKTRIYRHEMTDDDHRRLLRWAIEASASVMVTGYRCELYDTALASWWRADYRAMTRGGVRVESVWTNFEPGRRVAYPQYVGDGYRERERIKRKRSRWVSRLLAMPAAERAVIRAALDEVSRASPS